MNHATPFNIKNKIRRLNIIIDRLHDRLDKLNNSTVIKYQRSSGMNYKISPDNIKSYGKISLRVVRLEKYRNRLEQELHHFVRTYSC